MKLTVIVLNWNGSPHVEACFSALAAQSFRDFETIMVDNASTDGSVEIVRKKFPWVRLIQLEENRGFAGGNAAGLAAAQGQMIVLLNNDTAVEPGWLEALVAAGSDPRRGAIASLILDWTGECIDSAGDGLRVTGFGYQRFHGRSRAEAPPTGPVFAACGCAVLYRREMLEEVGFLDERFFMNGEDTDLCFRARLAGWEVWYCAEAVVRHRAGGSQGVNSASSIYYHERNRLWSLAKCMPACLMIEYSWVFILELLARAWYYFRRERLWAWVSGLGAGLAGLGPCWNLRKAIQTGRRAKIQEVDAYLVFPRQLGGRSDGPLPIQ